tara:strand:+ start:88 stop:237 length:150 start_codon:yes stop_codon:yes gene_type:complete
MEEEQTLEYIIYKLDRIEKLLFKLHNFHGIVKALTREQIMFVGESDNED